MLRNGAGHRQARRTMGDGRDQCDRTGPRRKESIEVRTGSSGVTYFTLNGTALGALGPSGIPETWLFAPPDEPVKTQRR